MISALRRSLTRCDRYFQALLLRRALARFASRPGTALVVAAADDLAVELLKEGSHTVYAVPAAKKLLFPDQSFDYVFSRGLLENLPAAESRRAWQEILRVSRDFIFLLARVRGISPLQRLCSLFFPELLPVPLLTLKELLKLTAGPSVRVLKTFRPAAYERSIVLLALQKIG